MPNIKRIKTAPALEREIANLKAASEKENGTLAYVAAMADIDIPEEETDNGPLEEL
ncbi:MAG: hypothetical protein WCS21_05570 [Lachnospiraceae bacterium]